MAIITVSTFSMKSLEKSQKICKIYTQKTQSHFFIKMQIIFIHISKL